MPYRSNKELPPAVKDALPKSAQDIWRNVANSVLADKGTEEKAAASAWAAVKRAGYEKDAKGQWVKVGKAQYQGQTVALNKPFRLPSGSSKKFGVYVKDGDNVKRVTFGDPNMEIRRDDPEARRSFRARHRCDQQKDKTTAAWWACKMWEKGATVATVLGKGSSYEEVSHTDDMPYLWEEEGGKKRCFEKESSDSGGMALSIMSITGIDEKTINKARDVWNAYVYLLEQDEGSLLESESQILLSIRKGRDHFMRELERVRRIS